MKRHTNKTLVSLALLVSMLLSLLPNLPQATATDLTAASPQEAAVLPEKSEVYQLDASCKLLSYVDEAVFTAGNHIARLPSEETLSSYAFLNSDGTKTVYYMNEAVKFIDADGSVVEKDITLTSTKGGYTTTRNDIQLTIPTAPANGIRLTYGEKYVTLIPEGSTFHSAAQVTDSTVTYPNYFGAGMSLVYTPTLSGVKEDIVLQSYTGVNSFTFTLNTNGLNLYQANGRYFLAESKLSTQRFELGDVVAFDARGRFSVGTMTVTTVMPGQAYRITATMDEDFLSDAGTVYPLSVDSYLTVSDNTHGAGAIEDTTIYQGRPNANGNWTYLHCGYYSSTYTVARTLFRLTGLTADSTYQSMSANDIVSATFRVKEATGTTGLEIKLHANTGSAAWTESGATWNNAGVVLDTNFVSATANSNADTYFDITDLVKDWKANPQDAAKGFVLKSTNESTLDKAFYSSEFGTTSYRPYVTVTYNLNTAPSVPNGVYRIISKSANKPIGAAQSIAEWTDVATQNTYTESALEMFQLWKITHLANGLYSVRPLHKLTMGLHASGTDVYICATSTIDTIVSIPTIARWQIQETTNGYTFQQLGNPNATMMAATSATGTGVDICIGTYSASSAQCHFELSPVEDTQGALFLFNTSNNTYTSSLSSGMPTVSMADRTTKTLAELGYVLSVSAADNTSEPVQWSSSNHAVAIVDSDTGEVTTMSPGKVVISATTTIEDTYHIVDYELVVEISNQTYYIRNAATEKYVDTNASSGAISATPFLAPFEYVTNPRWAFIHWGDGVFTIRSYNTTPALYLSVNGQSVVLKATTNGTIDETMMWKASISATGRFILSPLSLNNNNDNIVLGAVGNDQSGLQLQTYTNDTNYNDEWYLYQHNPCGLNVYFDETHLTLRCPNFSSAVNEILEQLETAQEEYLERFNIEIIYSVPELYATHANTGCTAASQNTICSCVEDSGCFDSTSWNTNDLQEYHHTNILNIAYRMPRPMGGIDANVLYIGHQYCYHSTNSAYVHLKNPPYGQTLDDEKTIVLATYREGDANANYTRTLIHEIGHLFGAIDHYGNGSNGVLTTKQLNEDPQYSGDFNDVCIYGPGNTEIQETNNLPICPGCEKLIRKNANKYLNVS